MNYCEMKKKTPRNQKYLAFIRSRPSAKSGIESNDYMSVVAHHVRTGNGGGQGLKVSDYWTIPLTAEEHNTLHAGVEREYYERHGINTDQEICANLLVYIAKNVSDYRSLREKLVKIIEEER